MLVGGWLWVYRWGGVGGLIAADLSGIEGDLIVGVCDSSSVLVSVIQALCWCL